MTEEEARLWLLGHGWEVNTTPGGSLVTVRAKPHHDEEWTFDDADDVIRTVSWLAAHLHDRDEDAAFIIACVNQDYTQRALFEEVTDGAR